MRLLEPHFRQRWQVVTAAEHTHLKDHAGGEVSEAQVRALWQAAVLHLLALTPLVHLEENLAEEEAEAAVISLHSPCLNVQALIDPSHSFTRCNPKLGFQMFKSSTPSTTTKFQVAASFISQFRPGFIHTQRPKRACVHAFVVYGPLCTVLENEGWRLQLGAKPGGLHLPKGFLSDALKPHQPSSIRAFYKS